MSSEFESAEEEAGEGDLAADGGGDHGPSAGHASQAAFEVGGAELDGMGPAVDAVEQGFDAGKLVFETNHASLHTGIMRTAAPL